MMIVIDFINIIFAMVADVYQVVVCRLLSLGPVACDPQKLGIKKK